MAFRPTACIVPPHMAGPAPAETPSRVIDFRWLVRFRWGALAGQVVGTAFVGTAMGVAVAPAPVAVILGLQAASNLAASRRRGRPVPERAIGALLLLDVVLFTALLTCTGGSYNPFTALYVVWVVLAAVMLGPAWAWAVLAVAAVGYGSLFAGAHDGHGGHLLVHLRGMWVAFGLAAGFIVYFVYRLRAALDRSRSALAAAQALSERNERLAALATLSAGAAHELRTPLSTIAVVARELARRLPPGEDAEDARLVRAEVERCRRVLDRMVHDAGAHLDAAPEEATAAGLVEAACERLDGRDRIVVTVEDDASPLLVPAPVVAQALEALLANALEASPPGAAVVVAVRGGPDGWRFDVSDDGPGMAPEVLERACDPFFTTRPAGSGMGLGLFLARAVAERCGGHLSIRSAVGGGTRVRLVLPADLAAHRPGEGG